MTQRIMTLRITGYNMIQSPRYVLTFFAVMRNVIMLSVTRHSVMAPPQTFELAERDQRSSLFVQTFIDED